jgi:hypothetical protein
LAPKSSQNPLQYLFWIALLFVVYEVSFWFDAEPLNLALPVTPMLRLDSNSTTHSAQTYPQPSDLNFLNSQKTTSKPLFDRLGHIEKNMPKDGRLRWVNREGESASCWLERGQILICPPLTQDRDLELEVIDVVEIERSGIYDYELILKEVASSKTHKLPLSRLNRKIRLY